MPQDRYKVLTDSIRRLLRRNAISYLRKIVRKTHAADLARVFPALTPPQRRTLFKLIGPVEDKGVLFIEFHEANPEDFLGFVLDLPEDDIVPIFSAMSSDDVADIMAQLPDEKADAVLKKMNTKDSEDVENLLRYPDDTAGGIMTTEFIALRENLSAADAIRSLQKEHVDVEMPFYLYVVDEYEKLVGVCSLRQLVVVSPDRRLREFMSTDIFSVRTDTDQEDVARLVARYDILAVPVVDQSNKLVGIVTVDDVIDIIREEATEDILKMAGAGAEFVETKTVLKSLRIRLPWLFTSFIGGILATFIIGRFENGLKAIPYLATFIPIIMGMGGNVGTQASTIVVRGLSTGGIHLRELWTVVSKELAVGFLLGGVYGLMLGSFAQFKHDRWALSLCVGLAMMASMSVAAMFGSLVPMIMARLNIDPAVATGPFVTTSTDIISVFFYFQLSTFLLGL